MAEAHATLPLGQTDWTPVVRKQDRERWNDWGIGLLLQGDLKGAEYAFQRVTEADPSYADGWVNVARALIQEGETDAAKPYLAKALALRPRLGRAEFFQAAVEKADGDYDGALRSLQTARDQYPRDRVVLNQIARIQFLQRRYADARGDLEGRGRRGPGGRADALHGHALLSRPGQRGRGRTRGAIVPPLQGRRIVASDHRNPPAGQPGGQQRAAIGARPRERSASGGEMRIWPLVAIAVASVGAVLLADNPQVQFTDVTAAAGIHFTHNAGRTGKKYLPETLGAGCAFFDADGDGWPDILLINGKDFIPRGHRTVAALYHNNHNGTFTDVTTGSGLDVEMYGMGVAIADYDNDGRDDVYITALDGDHLFHNEGNGKFRDVTAASGIHNADFGTSAAWLDYDRDGKVDLFVANYVQWTREGRPVVLAGRLDQVLLHAGVVQRHVGRGCSTTWATGASKTSPRRPASAMPPASRWA